MKENVLFVSGTGGYHTYRIPSLQATRKGVILAFVEGRKNSSKDFGDIDILLKRSIDGGRHWTGPVLMADFGQDTCGNACPVEDEETGTIWLLFSWNRGNDEEEEIILGKSRDTRRIYVTSSKDEGISWAKPKEITRDVKNPLWGWYASAAGIGIQIKRGAHRGRLVIPADHSYPDPKGELMGGPYNYGSNIIYSDDHGVSWRLGGVIHPKVNECQAVELADGNGTLMMNMRSYWGRFCRAQSISRDGGTTWSAPQDNPVLIEPVCQAAFLRYSRPDLREKSRLLFSNPASRQRENLTVRLSYDDGQTWPIHKTVFGGLSAYSSLAVLPNGKIGCLYERGQKDPYEELAFARFDLAWLTDGRDESGK